MKLGIVGAESYHTRAFAEIANVFQLIRGVRVTHVWGETEALAREKARIGRIPCVVRHPQDMIPQIDAVLLCGRDGRHRLAAAKPFLKAGLPIYADKPLAASLADARTLLRLRTKAGVPLLSSSVIPLQACVGALKKGLGRVGELLGAQLVGPGDVNSPYSGLWFYAIHLTDLLVELFGPTVRQVQTATRGPAVSAVCSYADGRQVALAFRPNAAYEQAAQLFSVSATGRKGLWQGAIAYDRHPGLKDPNPYVVLMRMIVRMFRTGKEPLSEQRMLAPVAILEAIEASRRTGRPAAVARV